VPDSIETPGRMLLTLPQEESYTVKCKEPNDLDMSICYSDILIDIDAASVTAIEFIPSGGVILDSEKSKSFDFSLTYDVVTVLLPWSTIDVTGKAAETTSLETTSEGIVISGDGASNLTINGELNGSFSTVTIPEIDDKALIKAAEPGSIEMAVYIDSDNNGSFDMLVQHDEMITPTKAPTPTIISPSITPTSAVSVDDKSCVSQTTLIIIASGILLLSLIIVLLWRRKRHSK
jgi:LPXTG-motif cell wall-anchored protein